VARFSEQVAAPRSSRTRSRPRARRVPGRLHTCTRAGSKAPLSGAACSNNHPRRRGGNKARGEVVSRREPCPRLCVGMPEGRSNSMPTQSRGHGTRTVGLTCRRRLRGHATRAAGGVLAAALRHSARVPGRVARHHLRERLAAIIIHAAGMEKRHPGQRLGAVVIRARWTNKWRHGGQRLGTVIIRTARAAYGQRPPPVGRRITRPGDQRRHGRKE
jgi:hypothetical protein